MKQKNEQQSVCAKEMLHEYVKLPNSRGKFQFPGAIARKFAIKIKPGYPEAMVQ